VHAKGRGVAAAVKTHADMARGESDACMRAVNDCASVSSVSRVAPRGVRA